ncbi:MAG: hypothetical protein K2F81_06925 [Ruminococcus sp.]|nr:hypothetical protein [Ruminococcus sp.]
MEKLLEKYEDNEIPDKVLKEFYNNIDKTKTNCINEEMMEKINSFFEKSIA